MAEYGQDMVVRRHRPQKGSRYPLVKKRRIPRSQAVLFPLHFMNLYLHYPSQDT